MEGATLSRQPGLDERPFIITLPAPASPKHSGATPVQDSNPIPVAMVCDICKAALQRLMRPDCSTPHHTTLASYKRSVQIGCFICTSFPLQEERRPDLPNGWDATVASVDSTLTFFNEPWPSIMFMVYVRRNIPFIPLKSERYNFDLLDGDTHPKARRLSPSTRSTQTFSTAKQWIATCTQSHEECTRRTSDAAWYPTRLLECRIDGNSETLRLVETGKTAVDGPYMTLSHCWGNKDCLKLTTDNYTQLLQEIPISTIPRLYRDALVVIRELNVKYLWIDSLCIIQHGDNSTDWDREVNLMDQVYSNSFCNISALTAPDSHQSMFHDRDPDAMYPPTTGFMNEWPMINKPSTIIKNLRDRWNEEVLKAKLNTRGWVFQERLLSPRIIHFGRSQVYWECRRLEASEEWPEGFPEKPWRDSASCYQRDLYSDRHYTSAGWKRIIEVYSACDLSFPNDRLVAISAVARRAATAFQDTYVAGLWRSALEDLLAWQVYPARSTATTWPAEVYRAPSWSWASIDARVRFGERHGPGLLVKVQEVHLDYATADKMGRLKGGWLRLQGLLRQMEPRPLDEDAEWGLRWDHDKWSFTFEALSSELDARHERDRTRLLRSAGDGFFYCVPLWVKAIHVPPANRWEFVSMTFLLLEKLDNEGRQGDFRRVGFARVQVHKREWRMLGEFLGFSLEDDTVDWSALLDVTSAKLQTFTIE
ncbi:hypothetical protein RB598_008897 [Gaeumannomyces tritici]